MLNRRTCMATMATSGLTASQLISSRIMGEETPSKNFRNVVVFIKPLQDLNTIDAAMLIEKWNVGGFEASVRKGGWIEPETAEKGMRAMMYGLAEVTRFDAILATDINHIDHPDVKRVLEPASKLGIKYFRMAYYNYDLSMPITPQLDRFIEDARKLSAFCEQLNMIGLYQNHAGANMIGASLWDLGYLLDAVSNSSIRIALDIRHATIEANTAWESGFARIRDKIGAIYVKNATIRDGKVINTPLRDGNSSAHDLFKRAHRENPSVPISLHMEYIDHLDPALLQKRITAIEEDVETLKSWILES